MANLNQPSSSHVHPFANSNNLLEIIPNKIDVEEESRLYDDIYCGTKQNSGPKIRSQSPPVPPSVFSNDIWLGDNSGESLAFARDVKISGWTNVGDTLGGAYVVYDCVVKTKEGTLIHAHKRYSAFVELEASLHRSLPKNQRHLIPSLPPKAPLARYRPAFLDRRRRLLQYWLSAILLHPDIGSCQTVRLWIMD
ncbi:Phox homologous domain-containing protein [Infundibulicybe gibba]|nr:Phox homologous domain-containing protein [Infundibulicybe gibba]